MGGGSLQPLGSGRASSWGVGLGILSLIHHQPEGGELSAQPCCPSPYASMEGTSLAWCGGCVPPSSHSSLVPGTCWQHQALLAQLPHQAGIAGCSHREGLLDAPPQPPCQLGPKAWALWEVLALGLWVQSPRL